MADKVDVSKLTKAQKREMAIKMVDEAIEQEHCFINIMSSEDGTHCSSQIIGNGSGGVLAHCLVEIIKSDERLKRDVLNNLTQMMMEEMIGDLKMTCDDPECGCKEEEVPEQNAPSTDNVH